MSRIMEEHDKAIKLKQAIPVWKYGKQMPWTEKLMTLEIDELRSLKKKYIFSNALFNYWQTYKQNLQSTHDSFSPKYREVKIRILLTFIVNFMAW